MGATDPRGKGDVLWIARGPSRSPGCQRGPANNEAELYALEAEHCALEASVLSLVGDWPCTTLASVHNRSDHAHVVVSAERR